MVKLLEILTGATKEEIFKRSKIWAANGSGTTTLTPE